MRSSVRSSDSDTSTSNTSEISESLKFIGSKFDLPPLVLQHFYNILNSFVLNSYNLKDFKTLRLYDPAPRTSQRSSHLHRLTPPFLCFFCPTRCGLIVWAFLCHLSPSLVRFFIYLIFFYFQQFTIDVLCAVAVGNVQDRTRERERWKSSILYAW